MKKMTCLFTRDFSNPRQPVTLNQVAPENQWVLDGEGVATVKVDGTSCMALNGELYARYDAKRGKIPPIGAIPCQPAPDEVTGHWPHWVKVENQPEYKYHKEAFEHCTKGAKLISGKYLPTTLRDGTYELIGPKIQANPYKLENHTLIYHNSGVIPETAFERSFEGLKKVIQEFNKLYYFEGIVFHHPDGRMCKIRAKDFE